MWHVMQTAAGWQGHRAAARLGRWGLALCMSATWNACYGPDTISLPHAGGAFPGLIGRLDHGTRVRPELKHMKKLPSEYLRRFTYDTIGHDDRINMNLVRQVGADRVILGSDYCFDMGLDDPVATVARMSELSQDERDLILGKTARKLLRIE